MNSGGSGNSVTLYVLAFLAALATGGIIAEVLIEVLNGRPSDVNPVLSTLAGTAYTALFGGHFFTAQQTTMSDMRQAFVTAITGGPLGPAPTTPSASTGNAGGGSTPSSTSSENVLPPTTTKSEARP